MPYEKSQATREFSRWSAGYDRSILQWLLFGPAHRAIITKLRARFGNRTTAILDVGCGTGLFAARIACRPASGHDLGYGSRQRYARRR